MSDSEKTDETRGSQRRWEEDVLQPSPDASAESQDSFTTLSGLEVKRLYTPEDVRDLDYSRDLGLPGQYPFTRGIHPTMYRGRTWTMRMFSGLGTAEDTNKRFKYLLKHGRAA